MVFECLDREKVAGTESALHIFAANIPLWMLEEIRIQHQLCKKNERCRALFSLALLREVCLKAANRSFSSISLARGVGVGTVLSYIL